MAKINGELFVHIQTGCLDTLTAHDLHPFMVNSTQLAWQCFHKAVSEGRIDLNKVYDVANDDHIETALKKVFKR
jgi:hypothetical protein